ncbi:hypothetical protein [Raineya orbicola]|jgi:hypothetical protein|uniref:Uncharacterized protein n=1 Tax=Raineya orbicola TaxID=2016530 RepID=A0A2N3I8F6_9BACT|nr:hypothetical protein [Raineya orbicola]PKQ66569.1 hypothetical protein Rain11_2327 [Raineya orbicola]
MCKKFFISYFLFLSSVSVLFAQLSGQDAFVNTMTLAGQGNIVRTWDNRYQGMKGHPYVKNTWENAQIVSIDGKVYQDVPLKYDVYSNLAVVKNSKGDSIVTEVVNIREFTFKSSKMTFVKEPLLDNSDNIKNYGKLYEQLFAGKKVALLKNHRKVLLQADYQGGYSANRRYDELIEEYDYYLKKNGATIEKIKLNEKNLLKALSDKEKELKEYLKKEKLNLKTEIGVIRLLQYYETL